MNKILITHYSSKKAWLAAALSLLAATWCGTARANIGAPVTSTSQLTSWMTYNGGSPFYYAQNLTESESADGQPAAAANATYTVLGEAFSITNGGAGFVLPSATSNYTVTAIGLLISGYSTTPVTIHMFDITSNLTAPVTSSSTSYNFTANGDLLGNGAGLSWTNAANSGVEQQVTLPLTFGPNSYDQVVLEAGHIYSFEIWTKVGTGAINWFKESATADPGAWGGMGANNAALTTSRITIAALGQVGSSPHPFGFALYGYESSLAVSANLVTNMIATTNYWVDQFNDFGFGATNTYVGTNDYNTGGISNVWGNWFGSAWLSNTWNSTQDASGNPNSGSLTIWANFSAANSQYVVFDEYTGINPALNAQTLAISNFECDVLFDPSSTTQTNAAVNGGAPFYGSLQFGVDYPAPTYNSQDYYPGIFRVPAGTTNWTHIKIPLNPTSDPNLLNISDVLIHIYGPYTSPALNGESILYVDNVKFTGPAVAPAPPPAPTMGTQPAKPGLRVFAASTGATYDRQEVTTYNDGDQGWINQHFPVSYSFTLQDFPIAPGMQCHLFLVPESTMPTGNNLQNNEFVDFQASNNIWMDIVGGGNNGAGQASYTVSLLWKTNLPNANAANEALTGGAYTSSGTQSPVGTWTLTFNNNTSGTLTPPQGVGPLPFTINDANIVNDYAAPVMALIGLQPNSTLGEGSWIDYAGITILNTQNPIAENFTQEASGNSITTSGLWDVSDSQAGASTTALEMVTTGVNGTPLWVYWTLPDTHYNLVESPYILNDPHQFGGYGVTNGWVLPSQYSGYNANPITANRAGGTNWDLIPAQCLPSAEYPNLSNAYFVLSTNVPAN